MDPDPLISTTLRKIWEISVKFRNFGQKLWVLTRKFGFQMAPLGGHFRPDPPVFGGQKSAQFFKNFGKFRDRGAPRILGHFFIFLYGSRGLYRSKGIEGVTILRLYKNALLCVSQTPRFLPFLGTQKRKKMPNFGQNFAKNSEIALKIVKFRKISVTGVHSAVISEKSCSTGVCSHRNRSTGDSLGAPRSSPRRYLQGCPFPRPKLSWPSLLLQSL